MIAPAHAELHKRLESRRDELEQAILNRVRSISWPARTPDPEYIEGFRAATSAALDYGLAAIMGSSSRPSSIPAVLFGQARLAARNGVALDIVLRRYFAGYTTFGDFVVQECVENNLLTGTDLRELIRRCAAAFDRLVAAVTEEHSRESSPAFDSADRRRVEQVRALLAGELIDTAELAYDFDAWQLGIVGSGPGAEAALRALAAGVDCHWLLVRDCDASAVWLWLAGPWRLSAKDLRTTEKIALPDDVRVGIGEPAEGLVGWRLTHRQARAALSVALRGQEKLVRYIDVALLVSTLQDDLLTISLGLILLKPLQVTRGSGRTLCGTLHAYLAADRNVSSAAAALGVSRRTVTNRLHAAETLIGFPISRVASQLEIALSAVDLGIYDSAGSFPSDS